MKNNVLIITGAGGWLGYSLIKYLIDQVDCQSFDKYILCSQKSTKANVLDFVNTQKNNKSIYFNYCFGDLNHDSFYFDLHKLISPDDSLYLIHAASVIHPKIRSDFFRINLLGLKSLVKNILQYNVEKFIYISSNSPFGFNNDSSKFDEKSEYRPIGFYGISKAKAEKFLIKKFNKSILKIVRAPWFHGLNMPDRQKLFLKKAANGKFPIINHGYNKRSLVNTIDLSIAIFNLIKRDSQHSIYWVCENESISMRRFIELIQTSAYQDGYVKKEKISLALNLPRFTSTIFCLIDIFIQYLGFYSKVIHVMGELGMNIEASPELYNKEFPDHKFTPIKISIKEEIKEAFM